MTVSFIDLQLPIHAKTYDHCCAQIQQIFPLEKTAPKFGPQSTLHVAWLLYSLLPHRHYRLTEFHETCNVGIIEDPDAYITF